MNLSSESNIKSLHFLHYVTAPYFNTPRRYHLHHLARDSASAGTQLGDFKATDFLISNINIDDLVKISPASKCTITAPVWINQHLDTWKIYNSQIKDLKVRRKCSVLTQLNTAVCQLVSVKSPHRGTT